MQREQHRNRSHWGRGALGCAAQWRSAPLPYPIIPLNRQQCATGKCMKRGEGTRLNSLHHENRRFIAVALHSSRNTLGRNGVIHNDVLCSKGFGNGGGLRKEHSEIIPNEMSSAMDGRE